MSTTRTQRWQPDTCPCVLEQTFEYPDDGGAATLVSQTLAIPCPAHAAAADVFEENQRKNGAINNILAAHPTLTSADCQWSVTEARNGNRRVVRVRVARLTRAQKDALDGSADSRFGAGNVRHD